MRVITRTVSSRRTFWAALVVAVAAVPLCSAGSGSATAAKAPRIVSAVMLDVDGDARADGVRLKYSVPVRHARDVDGRYPFVVGGYRVVGVGAAGGRLVTIVLAEKVGPDAAARPKVRYRPTKAQPVRDRDGRQAVAQLYAQTRPHGHQPPTPPVAPVPPPPDTDPDRDGYAAPADCRPDDPAINPGATDRPDLSFVDANCDGIDGDESKSIFVAANGDDANPGTRKAPKRQIQAAVAALGARRDILVAGGAYGRVELVLQPAGIGIFGGYGAQDWSRSVANATRITGEREGVLVAATREVVLQYLTIGATAVGPGGSTYGIRAFSPTRNAADTTLALRGVAVIAGPGLAGVAGIDGANGLRGVYGGPGLNGQCDGSKPGAGGVGGVSAIGRAGGNGGRGGAQGISSGDTGGTGQIGTPGGTGGSAVELAGYAGKPGGKGKDGTAGGQGVGGGIPDVLGQLWTGGNGTDGTAGAHGMGGGGGGGGGGQGGELVFDGSGNGGGGGGAGGRAGTGGSGGGAGGSSIALYLYAVTVTFDGGTLESSAGGAGGQGGRGGTGGAGGPGGLGATYCSREIGEGGNGGAGGRGGDGAGGGGGAGGSSIGIVQIGSKVTMRDVSIDVAAGGAGGGPTGIGPTSPTRGDNGVTKAVYEAAPS